MHRRYDSTNIPIELLRSFVAIAELGSLTKAADRLSLTQPAVSAQVKRLQQIVGADLLEKSGLGVRITDSGEMTLRYARRLLALNDQILMHSGVRQGFSGARIGISPIYAASLLPQMMRELRKIGPISNFQIECVRTADLSQRFLKGHLDVAVFPVGWRGDAVPRVEWSHEMVWIGSPLEMVSPGSPVPLIGWPGAASHTFAIEAFNRASQSYRLNFVAEDWATIIAAVKAGLGYLAIPQCVSADIFKRAREHFLPPLQDMRVGIFAKEEDSDQFDIVVRALEIVFQDRSVASSDSRVVA